ncbi:MAG: hypothetical protein DMG42_12660, partial [Acidobacteria bacterium]
KSRWHIENEGFNDAKNRYGLEHIRHHHERSLLIVWLLTCLAWKIRVVNQNEATRKVRRRAKLVMS